MSVYDEAMETLCKKAAALFAADAGSLGPDTRFVEDLGAKSVDIVKFTAILEDVFEVEVPYMEFAKKKTFGEAARYVASMLGE